jgi:hypothetical protein
MTDILAQIGNKLGAEVKLLQAQIDSDGGGGGEGHNHPDPSDDFTELTFIGGKLLATTTYTDSTKAVVVSSKAFSYNSNDVLTQIVESEGGVTHLTKTITYDSSGNLESVTKDFA